MLLLKSCLFMLLESYLLLKSSCSARLNCCMRSIAEFISPILARCVGVFCAKKDSQVLVNAVLDLFAVVTRKLSIYVDAAEDSRFLHQVCYILHLLLNYRFDADIGLLNKSLTV